MTEIIHSTGESRITNYIYHRTHNMKSHIISVHSLDVVSTSANDLMTERHNTNIRPLYEGSGEDYH